MAYAEFHSLHRADYELGLMEPQGALVRGHRLEAIAVLSHKPGGTLLFYMPRA